MNKEAKEILLLIEKELVENKDLRFTQVLFNLGINKFANEEDPYSKDYLLRDCYNDSDTSVLERIIKSDPVLTAVLECVHNFERDDFMLYLDYMVNKPFTEKKPETTASEEQLQLYRRLYKYIDDKVDDLLKEEEDLLNDD